MDEAAQAGMTAEELEEKRKARMERFGKSEVEESQEAIQKKGGFNPNRRFQKMHRKNQQKGGRQGSFGRNKSGGK